MKFRWLFSLIVFASLTTFGQNSAIADIERTVSRLKDARESFRKEERVNTSENQKIFYFKDNALAIVWVQEIKEIEKNVSWFFVKDQLIYSETSWLKLSDGMPIFSEKQYCSGGRLMAWINSENSFVDGNSEDFRKLDEDLQAFSQKLLNEAKE